MVGGPQGDAVAGQIGLQFPGGVVGDHPAVVDHHHSPGPEVRLLQVVGGEDDRGAELLVQPQHVLPDPGTAVRVEPGGGLVEEEHFRLVDQGHGDVQAAALATREGADRPLGQALQFERGHQVLRPGSGLRTGETVGAALGGQFVDDPEVAAGAVALAEVADAVTDAARVGQHVVAGDDGGARGRREESGQHPQTGGLPGAVGTEEGDHGAGFDIEVEAAHGFDGLSFDTEAAGEFTGTDHGFSHTGLMGGGRGSSARAQTGRLGCGAGGEEASGSERLTSSSLEALMTSLSVHLTVSVRLANRTVQVPLNQPDFIVLAKRRPTLAADEATGYVPRAGWQGGPSTPSRRLAP